MPSKRRAFITGITGQDGSYLTELLLEKGYEVHGFLRRGGRVTEGVQPHYGDLLDPAILHRALVDAQPDEVYSLGAQSNVGASFLEPAYSMRTTYEPVLTILEWAKGARHDPRVYQASSSEMFGDAPAPQNESSPFRPRSPYAIAKVAAHQLVTLYREAHAVFAVGGILMNHESPRRPPAFVTRKITQSVARIFHGKQQDLVLGNLEAKRDWGFAGDYVEAMWLILQQERPDDYVIATGETHSVREFAEKVFDKLGLDYQKYVMIDPRYFRPTEVDVLLGDATKARKALHWLPKVGFDQLIDMMIAADLETAEKEKTLVDAGYACGSHRVI